MGSTCCGKCSLYKENKKLDPYDYEGVCKKFKVKRSRETSSCEHIKPIGESVEREKASVGGDMFE